jgi:hypothetical protein
MFVRTVGSKGHRYVRIVENYREGGELRQRVIANLGNLRLRQRDLVQVIEGLRQLVDKVYVTEEEIAPQNGPEYGRIAVGIELWQELGVEESLSPRFARTNAKEIGPLYAQCMVLNRLCDTQVGPKKLTFVTPPNPRNQSILNALGLRLPKVLVEGKLQP